MARQSPVFIKAVSRSVFPLLLAGSFLATATAHAQLQWGANGAGGSGSWTAAGAWWDGTSNVSWTPGVAVFGGTGGTVTSAFPGVYVNGLTFNAPGYSLQGGWINTGPSALVQADFVVTTNAPATIDSTLSGWIGSALVKRGAEALIMTGTNFLDVVRVEQGEYRLAEGGTLFFSDVVLSNAAGVVVTLGQDADSNSFGSLSGGGALGGIVQPNSQARTVQLSVFNGGTFDGLLQDNGLGRLAIQLISPSATLSLSRAQTYSGATSTFGTLHFYGAGSAVNSESISVGGVLKLDNDAAALNQRLADTAPVSLEGGKIQLLGNAVIAVEETLGAVTYKGNSKIEVIKSGTTGAQLTFGGLTRQTYGTLEILGTGEVKASNVSNDASGILGPAVTKDGEWVKAGESGLLETFTNYLSTFAGTTANDHVKVTGATPGNLATSATPATVNWQNHSASPGLWTIGSGQTLTLEKGGLLSSGTSANQISGGSIRSGTSEFIVTNRNDLTVDSVIGQSISGTALVKTGTGSLTLTGVNTYTGPTVINEGTVIVATDSALGNGSLVQSQGGSLKAAGSFISNKGLSGGLALNTSGYQLEFRGQISGGLKVSGGGTLTLTDPTPEWIDVNATHLVLPSAQSGSVDLNEGKLTASGKLGSLSSYGDSTLDIGGDLARTLELSSLSVGFEPLTVILGSG